MTDYNTRFLDKTGTDHLIEELKEYIDGAVAGDIDLSSYVTQQELQEKLDALHIDVDLSAYATKEELISELSKIDLSGYATKAYVDNKVADLPVGGETDLSGYYTKDETYNKVEIDNLIPTVTNGKDGADGKNGEDGFSPTATVSKDGKTATITITDRNGTTTASISDGKDGSLSASGGGNAEVYSTEEVAVGTWIDGRALYQRVFDLSDETSKKVNGFQLYSLAVPDLIIDEVADSRLIVRNNSTVYASNQYIATIGTQSNVTGVVNAVNSNIINRGIFHAVILSEADTTFQIYIGTSYSSIKKIFLTVKYTKQNS